MSVFERYMEAEGHRITRNEYRENLTAKMEPLGFKSDCSPLLRPGVEFDLRADQKLVDDLLLAQLAGE